MNNLTSTHVIMLCFSCSRLRLIPVWACESQIQLGQWRLPEKNKRLSVMDSLFVVYASWIWRKALQSWSGHEVGRFPHRMPSNFSMTSSIFIPFTNARMPCRLPLHPPQKKTSLITPSSTSSSMWLLQVPCVLYTNFLTIILRLQPVSCWCKRSEHRRILRGVPPSCQ